MVRLLLIILFISSEFIGYAQSCKQDWDEFKEDQTEKFRNPDESPLTERDLEKFESLAYFDYNEKYCVQASFERTPNEEPISLKTNTERILELVKYGWLHFEIDGEKLSLALYQDPEHLKTEEYADYLFLPFGDETNGLTSYGAGRYIDFRIPTSDVIQLDLNQSYNPLCAYNHKYSCPKPPEENMLSISIMAGVKGVNLSK